jgi:hypothetical protein
MKFEDKCKRRDAEIAETDAEEMAVLLSVNLGAIGVSAIAFNHSGCDPRSVPAVVGGARLARCRLY